MKTAPSMNIVDFFTFCELYQLWQAVILKPLKIAGFILVYVVAGYISFWENVNVYSVYSPCITAAEAEVKSWLLTTAEESNCCVLIMLTEHMSITNRKTLNMVRLAAEAKIPEKNQPNFMEQNRSLSRHR